MSEKHFILGGDIKKSLSEGHRFDLKSLFKDAFVLTKKNFLPLAVASFVTISLLGLAYIYIFDSFSDADQSTPMVLNYIITLLIAPPLLTALQMMGIHHSVGLKTKANDLFKYFNIILKLSMAAMMLSLISNLVSLGLTQLFGSIGLQLSVVALLYFNMVFCLVNPLIAEKKLTPVLALTLSFKIVNKNLLQFSFIYLLLIILFFVAIITSGLGLLFVVPFYFNIMGIIYRQVCGVSVVAVEGQPPAENDNDNDRSSGFDA
ncbi:hypothetical protein CXF72_07730 [Psychromonas sp. MB-3u-54]|uniref:hypothetical protein n=1 Tax=Psychromonas sp. MB-3u-54 TaxID=2058319 RepID=UPI000C321CC0|nr:hypothetical protein [Psychromonas sp. MB-3u-54]PKH03204.1 hypothetical protein CXF72_07730 [Psychromonas sp. MB-3u-54]